MQAHSSQLIAQPNARISSLGLSAISYQLSALWQSVKKAKGSSEAAENIANRGLRIVIAGGGTGGHLFPGIAIAQEFQNRNSTTEIIFVSTSNRLEKAVLTKARFELQTITAAGIKGRGLWNQAVSALKILAGILESGRILKNFSPDLAIGLGSYSAGPVIINAWLRRIPIVIHEQNILPGITNRILARFADRIFISFENT